MENKNIFDVSPPRPRLSCADLSDRTWSLHKFVPDHVHMDLQASSQDSLILLLPNEVLSNILKRLDFLTLQRSRRVCSHFQAIIDAYPAAHEKILRDNDLPCRSTRVVQFALRKLSSDKVDKLIFVGATSDIPNQSRGNSVQHLWFAYSFSRLHHWFPNLHDVALVDCNVWFSELVALPLTVRKLSLRNVLVNGYISIGSSNSVNIWIKRYTAGSRVGEALRVSDVLWHAANENVSRMRKGSMRRLSRSISRVAENPVLENNILEIIAKRENVNDWSCDRFSAKNLDFRRLRRMKKITLRELRSYCAIALYFDLISSVPDDVDS